MRQSDETDTLSPSASMINARARLVPEEGLLVVVSAGSTAAWSDRAVMGNGIWIKCLIHGNHCVMIIERG